MVALGIVGSRIGRSRNGHIRNGRSRIGTSIDASPRAEVTTQRGRAQPWMTARMNTVL
jgi:hypothetical protein